LNGDIIALLWQFSNQKKPTSRQLRNPKTIRFWQFRNQWLRRALDPPQAKRELAQHGIGVSGNELGLKMKTARQLRREDYEKWDYLLGMEHVNLRNMMRILGNDPEGKVRLLMDFTGADEEIDDPWYTGDFAGVYEQIDRGLKAMLKQLGYLNDESEIS